MTVTANNTWNPISGCTPISPGCKNCYAKKLSNRLKGRFDYPKDDPFKIALHGEKAFQKPSNLRKPQNIFICSMGDLFHYEIPDAWIDEVFKVTTNVHRHNYLILTKRADRMHQYINRIVKEYQVTIPSNLWFGVTAENQEMADKRIPLLIDTPVPNRFISVEPMLTAVDLSKYINHLDWAIVGGETGRNPRHMNAEWATAIKNVCIENKVPFFFKEMSGNAPKPKELIIMEWPNSLK